MRIRKNRLSSLASSLKPGIVLQTHVCHLNQNPWDVMDFSPTASRLPSTPPPPAPPCQVDANDVFPRNVSFEEPIPANDIVAAMENDPDKDNPKWDFSGGNDVPEDGPVAEPEIVLCCKTDGKSWRCKQEAAEGNTLCHHHLLQSQRYTHPVGKKEKKKEKKKPMVAEEKPVVGRRPRAKKASSGSNPYEFYYYSGFGPTWGRRRDETGSSSKNDGQATDEMASAEFSPVDIQEFAYLDDEEDEEEKADNRRKRARKPVKARSLKSLM